MDAIGNNPRESLELMAKTLKDRGLDASHLNLSWNLWNLALWQEEDVKELVENPKNTLPFLDKIWAEIRSKAGSTIKPIMSEMNFGKFGKAVTFQQRYNIITTSGLIEMAKRGTAEAATTTGTTHVAIGTGSTAEALADVTLEAEKARKEFDTAGTRAVFGTTERYGAPFSRSDLSADETITEAGLLTKAALGELIARVTATGVTITTGRIMTVQVDITHANGTQV